SFNGFKTCSSTGDYGGCLAVGGADSSCNCNYGINYLDCLSAALAMSSCWSAVGIGDWDDYERGWFQRSCNKPPQSIMTELPQPSSVHIDYAPVETITPAGGPVTTTRPNHVEKPSYSGTGQLLTGPCSSTSYTLIDGGNMVYYAAFVGCVADRPACCPWSVSTVAGMAVSSGGGGGSEGGNRVAGPPGQFPMPADNVQGLLSSCPEDYYPVSGQCCPNGFFKFTSKIAHQTPCFSSLGDTTITRPRAIIAGGSDNPTDSARPTSAIVNVVWAMGYNMTATESGGLSKGATIGIGVGAGVFAIALVALLAVVFVRIRRSKKAA
ncbi:hypothetical protein B0H66DRAFT_446451, partial [Apodospora peruviana]